MQRKDLKVSEAKVRQCDANAARGSAEAERMTESVDVDLSGGDWTWAGPPNPRPVAVSVTEATRLVGVSLGGALVNRTLKPDAHAYAMRSIDAAQTEPKTGIRVYFSVPLSTAIGRNRSHDERDLFEAHRAASADDHHLRVVLDYADLGIL